jgi:hypothetical protein
LPLILQDLSNLSGASVDGAVDRKRTFKPQDQQKDAFDAGRAAGVYQKLR